jgi:hypothetical protein
LRAVDVKNEQPEFTASQDADVSIGVLLPESIDSRDIARSPSE